ncbi:MAG: polysaccharide deacetylase family protein [Candidatus Saccharibacteria bacterium]|nr:polysaccharide deacetylase family protein [Candidatus Saccharibacteria bacterium]
MDVVERRKKFRRRRRIRISLLFFMSMLVVGAITSASVLVTRNNSSANSVTVSESIEVHQKEEADKAEEAEKTEVEEKKTEKEKAPEKEETKKEEFKTEVAPQQNSAKKYVALTFDDGPSTVTTARLLDILKEKKVKATFFVVGYMIDHAPDLVKREIAEGHEIGSHTANHLNLSTLGAWDIQQEMKNFKIALKNATGSDKFSVMRPPGGNVNNTVADNVGAPMILWSVDTKDWRDRNAKTVKSNAVWAASDGGIILMHDLYETTVDAVPGVIDELRAKGFEFVTVSELAKLKGVKMQNGAIYRKF